ncbi:MAG: D-sedoheptulose 7-phosphate isomerase [Candidatus Cloacimonetes bacterium]|nr:D-sedoheptulose 7-phosphate isomerase [Candidatus Cloacimonadota bacterium]
MENYIKSAFKKSADNFIEFQKDKDALNTISSVSQSLADLFRNGNFVLICGNGGSSTDAMHFAEELTGRFRNERKSLPAISLTDPAHITCVGNDYGFSEIFARGVEAYGKAGDLLIAISTSGNSENVIKAVKKAKEKKMLTFCLLGKDGGKLNQMGDHQIIVPGKTTDRIQELHIAILHIMIEMVERILFPENYQASR